MNRFSPLAVTVLIVCAACSESTRTQPQIPDSPATMVPVLARHEFTERSVVPHNPDDRHVRRHLNRAIADDPGLSEREISFVVRRGNVNVTGTVRTEAERRRINDLAMGIEGVRSVANALRVLP